MPPGSAVHDLDLLLVCVTEDKKKSLPWYKQIELKQAEKEKKVCDAYGDLERDLYFLDMSAPD